MGNNVSQNFNSVSLLTDDQFKAAELFSRKVPLTKIADQLGTTYECVQDLLHSATLILAANDDAISDYLDFLEKYAAETGHAIFEPGPAPAGAFDQFDVDALKASQKRALPGILSGETRQEPQSTSQADENASIDQVDAFSSEQVRGLATSLLRMADTFEAGWSTDPILKTFSQSETHDFILANSKRLAAKAERILEQVKTRGKIFDQTIFGDPAWYMLLDLFIQASSDAKISTTSLSLTADCPPTTALRYIRILEESGLVEKSFSEFDGRVTFVTLSRKGFKAVGRFLEKAI